ncbi:Leptin Receptor Overlapping Transcript-Like 1 [Manis pentadactyla]|nr:Leptin Receptor Overlapping Transcript-Like 1 [Manis pentadactyla]
MRFADMGYQSAGGITDSGYTERQDLVVENSLQMHKFKSQYHLTDFNQLEGTLSSTIQIIRFLNASHYVYFLNCFSNFLLGYPHPNVYICWSVRSRTPAHGYYVQQMPVTWELSILLAQAPLPLPYCIGSSKVDDTEENSPPRGNIFQFMLKDIRTSTEQLSEKCFQ